MKTKNILYTGLFCMATLLSSCSDFEDTNKDPGAVGPDDVKPQWMLNRSIIQTQQDPNIAERIFVLTWKYAAHFERGGGFATGSDNNGWMTEYLSSSYAVGWLKDATQSIEIAQSQIDKNVSSASASNVLQMARIWRAYVMSEITDGFGPIPALESFQGINPEYNSEKDIYHFMLKELKEAEAALKTEGVDMADVVASDPFYGGKVAQWKKYANSLRMRLAMRLSFVEPDVAKENFEDAASKTFISEAGDIASIAERDGWDALTGVMSRTWNGQRLSTTFNNLTVGLGGVDFPVADELKPHLKDTKNYLGIKYDKHLSQATNDPVAGYFFDGIPQKIDPRAAIMNSIPGYADEVIYPTNVIVGDKAKLYPTEAGKKDTIVLTTKYTWNAVVAGNWGDFDAVSSNYIGLNQNFPCLSKVYRQSKNKRVFFGAWESYFLLAEAAVYGWKVPGTAQSNYEKGVESSLAYHNLSNTYAAYIASTDYNRVGTSVAFNHTAEAAAYQIKYIDGYTGQEATTTYTYPKNSVYKDGVNNDQLTKIITQKYIAQMPWLPLEAWSDHRRLGLPFFENQAVEKDYDPVNQVPLTRATAKESRLEFYPKRYRYPTTLQDNNKAGYDQALQLLGGAGDRSTTPLWWNKK